jgi:hypothetical protein
MIRLSDEFVSPETIDEPGPSFHPLSRLSLVILVGVTGVGKSRSLAELRAKGHPFTLLPNRRLVADQLIITPLQHQDGLSPQIVTDRRTRFQYTARYRQSFQGGMAHALTKIWVDIDKISPPLIFDGLRGLDEVRYAAKALPNSRFVILDAPDIVRVRRLLNRGDRFDTTSTAMVLASDDIVEGLQKIPGLETVFDANQIQTMARLASAEMVPLKEVIQKVSIIVEERRNYDPEAAKRYLNQTLSPERRLIIETALHPPEAVAEQIARWVVS